MHFYFRLHVQRRYGLTIRNRLTDSDVEKLVFKAIELIDEVQIELGLPISSHIMATWERLRHGVFKAMPLNKKEDGSLNMDFGSFIPPSTIVLDYDLPSSDSPLHMPELAETMTLYSAVHEVIHAGDHITGNTLFLETCQHILKEHKDKLSKGMNVIREQGGSNCIRSKHDLAALWAIQYVDVVTHYRTFVVLRHKSLPKLDHIWSRLREEHFPPNLLTCIERHNDTEYVFKLFNKKKGEYCFIEAFQEYQNIKEQQVKTYTV